MKYYWEKKYISRCVSRYATMTRPIYYNLLSIYYNLLSAIIVVNAELKIIRQLAIIIRRFNALL